MDASNVAPAAQSRQDQHRAGDRYDRRAKHVNAAQRLLERLRQVNKDGERPPSTLQLKQESIFALRPVNRLGDLRRIGHDIQRIKAAHGICCWKLHESPRPLEQQEWCNQGRRAQLFLSEQQNGAPWEHREHVQRSRLGLPLPTQDLQLFAEMRP